MDQHDHPTPPMLDYRPASADRGTWQDRAKRLVGLIAAVAFAIIAVGCVFHSKEGHGAMVVSLLGAAFCACVAMGRIR
jgi:hypothetical protein